MKRMLRSINLKETSHHLFPICARFLSDTTYDVIICGGGMVGTATAAALATSPKFIDKKILLIEAGKYKTPNFSGIYSNRVSALSPASKNLMTRVGAWEHVEKARYHKIKRMQVWDACSNAVISFTSPRPDDHDVAYTLENNLIVNSFLKVLEAQKERVEILESTRIEGYELPKAGSLTNAAKVLLKNGDVLNANLLIGADSWRSTVRTAMDVNYIKWSYDQMGLVATIHFAESVNNCVAWQRFLPDSTICLLPLSDKSSSLVWCTSLPHAKQLMNMDGKSFVAAINDAFWKDEWKIPQINSILKSYKEILNSSVNVNYSYQLPPSVSSFDENSRAPFMLGLGHSCNYVAPRVALIGDAAHRVHPHAGQGVNLGFGDVETLVKVLEEAISCGADIGSLFYLMKYESEQQRKNVMLMAAIDALHRLYKTDFTPIVLLRSLGLQTVDAMESVKRLVMERAVA